jgi:hypothetical protein
LCGITVYKSKIFTKIRENFHFGLMAELFNNHEITDVGDFCDGWGVEYSLRYHFGKDKKWRFVNNSYILVPMDKDMEYMVNRYTFNIARRFNDNFTAFAGIHVDNSINADGLKPNLHAFGFGFIYGFNNAVPQIIYWYKLKVNKVKFNLMTMLNKKIKTGLINPVFSTY